jgi:anionic cell wall polymer biosynthesis LytR-Cps2A-Psr (LCP) family protein
VSLALAVLVSTGGAWGMKAWYNAKLTEVSALDAESADIQNAPAQTGDANFLIVGTDSRAGATGDAEEALGSADDVEGVRADTVMLAHLPANRSRAVIVSFPRDLEVTAPECPTWDSDSGEYSSEVAPGHGPVKLNAVYHSGGPQCVTTLTVRDGSLTTSKLCVMTITQQAFLRPASGQPKRRRAASRTPP